MQSAYILACSFAKAFRVLYPMFLQHDDILGWRRSRDGMTTGSIIITEGSYGSLSGAWISRTDDEDH
jgi:hypothetical protein